MKKIATFILALTIVAFVSAAQPTAPITSGDSLQCGPFPVPPPKECPPYCDGKPSHG